MVVGEECGIGSEAARRDVGALGEAVVVEGIGEGAHMVFLDADVLPFRALDHGIRFAAVGVIEDGQGDIAFVGDAREFRAVSAFGDDHAGEFFEAFPIEILEEVEAPGRLWWSGNGGTCGGRHQRR